MELIFEKLNMFNKITNITNNYFLDNVCVEDKIRIINETRLDWNPQKTDKPKEKETETEIESPTINR